MDFNKNLLIFPMAFYAFWIFCTAIYLFRMRVRGIKSHEIKFNHFKAYTDAIPEYARIAERHYENQFEVPTMFFSVGIMHFALGLANPLTLGLMWSFVLSRMLHTFIHLGSNYIFARMYAFLAGWIVILVLWAQMVYFVI